MSLALLLVASAGCESSEPVDRVADTQAPGIDDAELLALERLGYVDYAPGPAGPESGVVLNEASLVQPGYRLYSDKTTCTTLLRDTNGTEVHRWSNPPCLNWEHSALTRRGELVVPLKRPGGKRLLLLAWDGDVIWESPMRVHHDIEPSRDGGFLVLTFLRRGYAYSDHAVGWVDASGRLQRQLWLGSMWDPAELLDPGSRYPFHANSVEAVPDDVRRRRGSPVRPGLILVCVRNQNSVVLIDPEESQIVWRWGADVLDWPHDAHVTDDGHVTVFDNGRHRGWSRVLEIDPASGEILWSYGSPDESHPDFFFSETRGAAEILPNGNVLATVSNRGWSFEVTREGRRVWSFFNPTRGPDGQRGVIMRMSHYDADLIEPLVGLRP